jgi:hypothetical protein
VNFHVGGKGGEVRTETPQMEVLHAHNARHRPNRRFDFVELEMAGDPLQQQVERVPQKPTAFTRIISAITMPTSGSTNVQPV